MLKRTVLNRHKVQPRQRRKSKLFPTISLDRLKNIFHKSEQIKAKEAKSEPAESKSQNFSSYIIVAIMLIFAISLLRNITNVRQVNQRLKDKEQEVQKARLEQVELERKLAETKSGEFVEAQLRNQLGMAKEGEIIVVLPPAELVRKLAPRFETELQVLPDPNWKKWVKLFI